MTLSYRTGRCLGTRRSLYDCRLQSISIARFSQCRLLRNIDNAASSNADSNRTLKTEQETTQDGKEQQPRNQAGKRKNGIGIPALAIFAIGLPLGWYLKNRYSQERGTRLSDPSEFVKYALVGKDSVSSTSAIFRLRPASNVVVDQDEPTLERAITSVEFKQPQLQIARSYTCLPQQDGQHMDELRFLIRKEQKGEVSNFLHRLPIGSEIELRGLHAEFVLPNDVNSVVFLVGGTGIAPAVQATDKLDGQAAIHILWASRKREDCIGGYNDTTRAKQGWSWWSRSPAAVKSDQPIVGTEKGPLVSMLEKLKQEPGVADGQRPALLVDYYVDEEGAMIKPEDVKRVLSTSSKTGSASSLGKRILIVSGPEGFISHWAGPKQWANGKETQGLVRGVLSTLDLGGWEVVKL
ncbi:cytochrome c mitochondrial import factor CYC2-like [Lecanosticta acicola]|uniref:Cytochrome c mitochondrial import factor CYC2-like n=1 Tax=Lecanosticta acicola TaxID=111012 RepID=A0AAI8YTL2_9PEZI|nr:cytochrome c mitochondrial import factor CYC2-like [Lecanosticta acicola]